MTSYLTTREIQDLLKVDRSTVYRMAEDGRLPGIKVGRQWRFPAERIEALFGASTATVDAPSGHGPMVREREGLDALLPSGAIDALARLLGDLMGAMVIITDMTGRPLTDAANPCGLYDALAHLPGVHSRCVQGWRAYADDAELEPRFQPSPFGFLCARGFIRVGTALEGMVIVGGFAPAEWPPSPQRSREIARTLGVSEELFETHVASVFRADAEQLDTDLSLLSRISALVSHMATSRSELVERLRLIADLASTQGPT